MKLDLLEVFLFHSGHCRGPQLDQLRPCGSSRSYKPILFSFLLQANYSYVFFNFHKFSLDHLVILVICVQLKRLISCTKSSECDDTSFGLKNTFCTELIKIAKQIFATMDQKRLFLR